MLKMENKERLIITEHLFSEHKSTVLAALATVKVKGDAELLKSVIQLLHLSDNQSIKSEINDILCSLKQISAVPILIEALQNVNYITIRKEILTGCWMSGLVFRDSLSVFVDIFLETDFLTAFEAFTVIENCFVLENQQASTLEIEKMNNAFSTINSDKKQIFNDLLKILEAGPLKIE